MKFRVIFVALALVIIGGWYVVMGNSSLGDTAVDQSVQQPQPSADDDALRKSLGQ